MRLLLESAEKLLILVVENGNIVLVELAYRFFYSYGLELIVHRG